MAYDETNGSTVKSPNISADDASHKSTKQQAKRSSLENTLGSAIKAPNKTANFAPDRSAIWTTIYFTYHETHAAINRSTHRSAIQYTNNVTFYQ